MRAEDHERVRAGVLDLEIVLGLRALLDIMEIVVVLLDLDLRALLGRIDRHDHRGLHLRGTKELRHEMIRADPAWKTCMGDNDRRKNESRECVENARFHTS